MLKKGIDKVIWNAHKQSWYIIHIHSYQFSQYSCFQNLCFVNRKKFLKSCLYYLFQYKQATFDKARGGRLLCLEELPGHIQTCFPHQKYLEGTIVDWYRGLQFTHHTSKYAFFTWLAILNRLTTGDRMLTWNTSVNPSCVFCNQLETRNHLFFSCPYTSAVWTQLMSGLLGSRFTIIWEDIMALTIDNSQDMITTFLTRYGFQVSLHSLWRERNDRRHGVSPTSISTLVTMLDRHIRNRCSSIIKLGDQKYAASLSVWFATR